MSSRLPSQGNYVEYRLKVSTSSSLQHHVMSVQSASTSLSAMSPPLRISRDRKLPFVSLSAEDLPGLMEEGGGGAGPTSARPPSAASMRQKSKIITQDSEFNKNVASALGDDIYPWVLEDADGDHAFIGRREKNQESSYVFFVNQGSSFMIVPVNKWYRFTPKSFSHPNASGHNASPGQESATLQDSLLRARKLTSPHSHMDELDYEETFDDDEEVGFDEEQLYGNPDDPSAPVVSSRSSRHLSSAGARLKRLVSSIDRDAVELDSDQEDEDEVEHGQEEKEGRSGEPPRPVPAMTFAQPAGNVTLQVPKREASKSPSVMGSSPTPSSSSNTPSPQKAAAKRTHHEATASPVRTPTPAASLTEAMIVQYLRSNQPVKTKDMIMHFRNELRLPDNKQLFRDIVKKVAAVTAQQQQASESEKQLVLKPEYQ